MIKTLVGSIRDYMKVTVATPLLVLGEVLCEMLIPFITANLIDAIKDGTTVAEMLPTAGFLVLIALTSLAFGAAAGVTCSHASCGFAKNLRHDLFYKIQTFSFANIDEFSSSSLVTRLTTDINNVQQAFMMIIRIAVRAPLVLIFAFTMAFIMGGSVAMVYLVIIPLLGFGLFFIIFKVRPIFSRVFHKYDALNESVEENVTGMRVVKSYVREDFEKEKFATAARDVQMDFTRAEKLLAFNNPMMNICVNGAFVVIIYLGSKLIITSQGTLFDVGQLSSIFTYGFQILMSLMQLSMIFVMVTMADESAHRITEVLAAEPTIADPAEPVLEVADGSIDFDHVSFVYASKADKKVLDDIEQKPDFIVLDPPRDGIHPKALEKIISYGVEKMVYISCKPTSLARDLEVLLARGYEAERICCVDMFPQTTGIETVCLLGKRKPDAKVKIGIDMDDYYRIRENAESK